MRLAAALLFLAACGAAAPPPPKPPASTVAADALARIEKLPALDGAAIGPLAPEQRATMVVVFASWCHHCRQEIPIVGELMRTHPELRVIGLNAYEGFDELSDDGKLRAYLAEQAPWLRTARGDELLPALGGVPKIPSLFLFDARGRIAREYRRDRRATPEGEELSRDLAALLSSQK